jgi:hypothetical protein
MFKVSHQFIFCYLVKVAKNKKSAVLFVYFFFNSSKPVLTEKFFLIDQ